MNVTCLVDMVEIYHISFCVHKLIRDLKKNKKRKHFLKINKLFALTNAINGRDTMDKIQIINKVNRIKRYSFCTQWKNLDLRCIWRDFMDQKKFQQNKLFKNFKQCVYKEA